VKQILAMAMLALLGLSLTACIVEGGYGYHEGYSRHHDWR
jgi:hypothetical protein